MTGCPFFCFALCLLHQSLRSKLYPRQRVGRLLLALTGSSGICCNFLKILYFHVKVFQCIMLHNVAKMTSALICKPTYVCSCSQSTLSFDKIKVVEDRGALGALVRQRYWSRKKSDYWGNKKTHKWHKLTVDSLLIWKVHLWPTFLWLIVSPDIIVLSCLVAILGSSTMGGSSIYSRSCHPIQLIILLHFWKPGRWHLTPKQSSNHNTCCMFWTTQSDLASWTLWISYITSV